MVQSRTGDNFKEWLIAVIILTTIIIAIGYIGLVTINQVNKATTEECLKQGFSPDNCSTANFTMLGGQPRYVNYAT